MSRRRPDVTELDRLARDLRLTPKQRRFAEALAADPSGNKTLAALAAGCGSAAARFRGSKWLAMPKVRRYVESLRTAAQLALERRTADAVMSAAEVQERLTTLARADLGAHLEVDADGVPRVKIDPAQTYILREVSTRHGPEDEVRGGATWTETKVRVADPRPALEALARIKGLGEGARSDGGVTITGPVLVQLLGGGNGNGGRPDAESVRAVAKRLLGGIPE